MKEIALTSSPTWPVGRAKLFKASDNQNELKVEAIHSIRNIRGEIKLTRTEVKNKEPTLRRRKLFLLKKKRKKKLP